MYLNICLFIYLSINLSIYLSFYLSIYPEYGQSQAEGRVYLTEAGLLKLQDFVYTGDERKADFWVGTKGKLSTSPNFTHTTLKFVI